MSDLLAGLIVIVAFVAITGLAVWLSDHYRDD